MPPKRKLLTIVNPFGGDKKGKLIYNDVKKMLGVAHIDVTMMYSER